MGMIPAECTTADYGDSPGSGTAPLVYFEIFDTAWNQLGITYHWDVMHNPLMVDAEAYGTDGFYMRVGYYWFGQARPDYTLKAYHVDDGAMVTEMNTGQTNMLYTDGQEPSEFDWIKENTDR
jgi:hypothetical protein